MSVELNHYLEITRSRIHQIYRELESTGKTITVDLMRKLYYGVDEDSKTLLQVFREHNEQSRKLIGKDFVSKTVQRYETTTRYLEEFIKKEYQLSDIALNNLEANFISKFDAFLKIEKGCAQNSAITRLKNLKKIIRIALENDWIKKDPFAYYRFKLEETDPEFLTMDEIKIILAKEFTIKRVEQVRDVFYLLHFYWIGVQRCERFITRTLGKRQQRGALDKKEPPKDKNHVQHSCAACSSFYT